MAKPKITAITIRPTAKGGHKVTHEYAPAAKFSGGSRNGGMSMDSAPPAEHNFAPGEHNALLDHIAGALALKGLAQRGAGAGPGAGPGAGLGPGLGGGMPPGAA
jgi:hypothetical protein